MRRPLMAANWKMHKAAGETRAFFEKFKPLVERADHCDIVIAPPFTSLAAAAEAARGSNISLAAQDMHWEKKGAFTGEVAPGMIRDAGCEYVIVGHSERRNFFYETDDSVSRKLAAALDAGLTPIVCVGEKLEEREAGATELVLTRQFFGAFSALTASQFSRIILAYEPVWAIGTGRTATPQMAADAHRLLRKLSDERFGTEVAHNLRILYGGSVKPDNIKGLMAQTEIDGGLVGGASLDPDSFAAIVNF
ncbi:triose-phosphate isomerase [Acidobacteriia bacterium AH_259_A11_L15]|nr:triose-phosphate isomerase [Acidobacteriia bacterium AH_259_A11_L15]